MKINFDNLNEHSKEELISIIDIVKREAEESRANARKIETIFMVYKRSVSNSFEEMRKDSMTKANACLQAIRDLRQEIKK